MNADLTAVAINLSLLALPAVFSQAWIVKLELLESISLNDVDLAREPSFAMSSQQVFSLCRVAFS